MSEDTLRHSRIYEEIPAKLPDMDDAECHSIASSTSTVDSSNPYQPLSYRHPYKHEPQPKSWGTTAKVGYYIT